LHWRRKAFEFYVRHEFKIELGRLATSRTVEVRYAAFGGTLFSSRAATTTTLAQDIVLELNYVTRMQRDPADSRDDRRGVDEVDHHNRDRLDF
jgi:hypothetical protein